MVSAPKRRALLAGLLAAGCAPRLLPAGPVVRAPTIDPEALVMADGARLRLRRWSPEGEPTGVLLALHGFGDHSGNFFETPAPLFTAAGLAVYAYDQRGFGAAANQGIWAGTATLTADLVEAASLIRARHPGLKLTVLGESMGAAVVVVAAAANGPDRLAADAVVLSSPAIWSRMDMPPPMRWGLWLAAHTIPIVGFQAAAGGIAPTDNPEAIRRWQEDKLTLKFTRVDAAYGLVDLMDAAVAALPTCCATVPVLVLCGAQDKIVPVSVARRVLRRADGAKTAFYADGWHLLLRDLNRAAVAADVLAWLADPRAALPSGADAAAAAWLGAAAG